MFLDKLCSMWHNAIDVSW